MKYLGERCFNVNIKVLKLFGIYPSERYKSLHGLYGIVIFISFMSATTVFGTLHYMHYETLTNITVQDFIMVAFIFYAFKFLPIIKNKEKLKNCIHYFDDLIMKPDQEEIIDECVYVCRRNSIVYLCGCLIGLVGFVGQTVLREDPLDLPLNLWIPKFLKESRRFYYTIYFCVFLGTIYSVLVCSAIDPLIGGLSYLASAQIQILKKNFQLLDIYISEKYADENMRYSVIYQDIKKCVILYEEILHFVREYEDCFSLGVLCQFMGSSLVIGLSCFQLSKMSTVDIDFITVFDCLIMLFLQVFFYCYYGSVLVENNDTLCTAIYMSSWYEFDIRSQKALIILMERSNRQIVIKAGKLLELSLETFTTILRRAYSLVAILKN